MSALSILAEECELLNDSKYRAYITQVDKALRSFENTSEWADLISALGKLNKVLLGHVKFPVIPKRVTIGKRLAQCLHPALPSGVHLKALETYDIIFKCIGTQRLAQDLFIYSAGLFPLLGHAAMSVKPTLLTVYERHFIGLGRHIKPGLNGLLLGLLPGLDEGAEYYDRTNGLLEDFCESAEPEYFYTCMWECVMSCPSVRLPAITFLLAHYNKKQTMEDQIYMMGLNIDLMVEAMCSAAQDSVVLVQRILLDFLLIAFPMRNGQLTKADMAKIVKSVINVVLRRDMSLNRRLYAWLLGTGANSSGNISRQTADKSKQLRKDSMTSGSEIDLLYFRTHSKDLLIHALKQKLSDASEDENFVTKHGGKSALVLKPFRILMSLLDKPEIGPVILESVLLSVFRCLYRETGLLHSKYKTNTELGTEGAEDTLKQSKSNLNPESKTYGELIKTANLLFGTFEPYFIWDYIARMFEESCQKMASGEGQLLQRQRSVMESDIPSLSELCTLVNYLLEVISLETFLETQTEHLPDLLYRVTTTLTSHCTKIKETDIKCTLQLCIKLLAKVQPSMDVLGLDTTSTDGVSLRTDQTYGQQLLHKKLPLVFEGYSVSSMSHQSDHLDGHKKSQTPEARSNKDISDDSCKDRLINGSGGVNGHLVNDEPTTQSDQRHKDMDETEPNCVDDKNILEENGCVVSTENGEEIKANGEVQPMVNGNNQTFEKTEVDLKESVENKSEESRLDISQASNEKGGDSSLEQNSWHNSGKSSATTMMQSCIECYKNFFHTYITQKIFQDPSIITTCINQMKTSTEHLWSYRDEDDLGLPVDQPEDQGRNKGPIRADHLQKETLHTFDCACRLLLDFTSFPIFCTDFNKMFQRSFNAGENVTLPMWLQDLIACGCFVESFEVQSAAIATMIDLIIVAKTIQSDSENKVDIGRERSKSVGEGSPVSVVIMPALLPIHLKYLGEKTTFYKSVASILWGYLDEATPTHHQQTVQLFHHLHQVTPDSWVCEDVIGHALVSEEEVERIGAFKKLTVLWHLTRDSRLDPNPGQPPRTFDRSMLVLLDSLKEEISATKTIATTWLTHVIQRGDICRVLNPLLSMLLHPDTARISVQHINVHKPKKVPMSEEEDIPGNESQIYAISSEGGNIIYHVNSASKPMLGKRADDVKSFALTSMDKQGSATTAQTRHQQEMHFDRVRPSDLSLCINPFGSESSLDKLEFEGYETPTQQVNLNGATRLNRETCAKEGIFFDTNETGSQSSTETSCQQEDSPLLAGSETVINDILMEVLNNVVPPSLESSVPLEQDDPDDIEDYILEDLDSTVPKEFESKGGNRARLSSVSSKTSSVIEDQDILNTVDNSGMDIDSPTESEVDLATSQPTVSGRDRNFSDVHPLHMHMLLYTQKYDHKRTLYALTTLKSMLVTCPRLVVTALVTTSISATRTSQLAKLQLLLARHRKSVFGKNFFGDLPPEVMSSYRSNMYIEVIISVCLYFVRSYFPNLMISKLSNGELLGNKEVHILATEILTLLMSELIVIMKESGKSFVSYIKDLLVRCKLQKALLHCCLASVYNLRKKDKNVAVTSKITEVIIRFNEENLDLSVNETFQIRLLNLMLVLIMLEGSIDKSFSDLSEASATVTSSTEWERPRVNFQQSLLHARFMSSLPIVHQRMFLSCVLSAMKQSHNRHMHRHWVAMVTSSLPFMGKALPSIVMNVVAQLCRNIEVVAAKYEDHTGIRGQEKMPPDHLLTIIEGMTTICHYCLLDNASPVSIGLPAPTSINITTETGSRGQIFTNLINVFNPIGSSRETSPQRETPLVPIMDARRSLLSIMPRIIACLTSLWKAVKFAEEQVGDESKFHPTWIMGTPKVVRQKILEFLSPISLPHGSNLLAAVGVAWNDRTRKNGISYKKGSVPATDDQLLLVDLVSAIRVLPIDTLVQTVKQVLKQPPPTNLSRTRKNVPLEVNMLQFFYAYVQQTSASQLVDSWNSLCSLLRDSLQLNLLPPGKFILLQILNEFVQKMPSLENKKNQKELQDITQKLLEAVGLIAGSSLEQTTWLRRNLAVKPGPQTDRPEMDDEDVGDDVEMDSEAAARERRVVDPKLTSAVDSKYSVQALSILAELTSPLLDVVYSSEEKDKIAPFLTTIMYNVFPYLRNHTSHNLPSYRACSQILASVSGYQYTRKAWRREALEMLLDPGFFQMDLKCIGYWRSIIDNLMMHDKTTFKDLMGRVTVTQSGSLSLFSSKEMELEQRSHMLKRLAFTIFCSEPDQYQKSMPEIQERLAESLRLPHQVPSIMAQVFVCFRVLILRMSSHHLTSLWPTVITEMVHVFMQIEQELSNDTEEYKTQIQRIAALDSTWAHFGNGLNAHNNPSWLQLYLSVCKLLDLALALPAGVVPQFQLYRWAFIGGAAAGNQEEDENKENSKDEKKGKRKVHQARTFVPHIIRLTKLINDRTRGALPVLKQIPGRPLLTQTYLRSLTELQPFFNTLCCSQNESKFVISRRHDNANRTNQSGNSSKQHHQTARLSTMPRSKSTIEIGKSAGALSDPPLLSNTKNCRQYIEEMLERDFLEPLSDT
ncbi:protein dopey-1-like isoform X2 [Mizuhopecten yessoensis]|uniref:protein dopey-1-like isoform X2 n=1 Tax=Mizuhopecten yessoensis TaxID=6573 RepID=UPI000B45DFFF|nr:protein dopey-1-like isoform X2 [Mizuhopecten yessoensis]